MKLTETFEKCIAAALAVCMMLICFSACRSGTAEPVSHTASEPGVSTPEASGISTEEEIGMKTLTMKIGGTKVAVDWEESGSVAALKELVKDDPLTIQMSMYGGFEQVGSIGASLPRNDVQTTTASGDIVLYSGNQIVVFYGSNTWAYTRLGHITDKSASKMKELLGNGDVTIEFSME